MTMSETRVRRRHGQGGIEVRKSDGACRGHYYDARGQHVRMPWCAGRRDAEEQLQAALEELEAGAALAVGGCTLRQWGKDFLDRREKEGSRNIKSERTLWAKHIEQEAAFIDWALDAVTTRDVRRWMARLNVKKTRGRGANKWAAKTRPLLPLAWQTKQHALNLLRRAFAVAIDDELVDEGFTNPCIGLKFKKPPSTERATNFFSRPEIEALQHVAPAGVLPLIEFAIATALRQGEMRALRESDVHLEANPPYITVRYGKPPKKPTKTGIVRDVPLLPMAVRALEAWMEFRATWCTFNPHGLVCPAERGGYRSGGKFLGCDHYPMWRALLAKAKIQRPLVWHDLRHTGATALLGGFFGRRWSSSKRSSSSSAIRIARRPSATRTPCRTR
jgi:integrase